jgi:periplasmic divalent cation tolerance protein
MAEYIQVVTTTGSKGDAVQVAQSLVEERLAACVQVIGPITSVYRWEGAVEVAEEWLCVVKSTLALYPDLEAAIQRVHPYDVPEILAVPVAAGSQSYLDWLQDEVRDGA